MTNKRTIVEVGANFGHDTERMFNAYAPCRYYAIEPTPYCITVLHERFGDNPDITLVQLAIDDTDGSKTFNIAGHWDWGCSSLHDFRENINEMWPDRHDLNYTDSITTQTMRLDTFMDIHDIKQIDYLWIDAQGSDFIVLKSLGERIHDVVQGQCEVMRSTDLELYQGVVNDHDSVNAWLNDNGFYTRTSGAGSVGELDIFFTRRVAK